MKVLLVVTAVLACAALHQVDAQNSIGEAFGAVCGSLSRRDCVKRIRSCRRLNTAMSEEIGSAEDILSCTQSLDVALNAIIDAWDKFNNGEGDAPTLESFGVNEGIMKEVRNCVLTSRGLMDAEGNLDEAAMEASVEATLRRIIDPDQPKLFDAMINAKQVCGKPTIDTMKAHRECMNQLCVDNIKA